MKISQQVSQSWHRCAVEPSEVTINLGNHTSGDHSHLMDGINYRTVQWPCIAEKYWTVEVILPNNRLVLREEIRIKPGSKRYKILHDYYWMGDTLSQLLIRIYIKVDVCLHLTDLNMCVCLTSITQQEGCCRNILLNFILLMDAVIVEMHEKI